jgi:hypothetical protein
MARCDVCGNDYDEAFEIQRGDLQGTFDSFECAIHAMAPRCAHCGCTIIGHGVQSADRMYCCSSCARAEESVYVSDRI